MGIIYCYTNKINNKKYIGQTINPEIRYNSHKSSAFNLNDKEYNSKFHQSIRKYGFENFDYEILAKDIEDIELLNILEKYYIDYYQTIIPKGYNVEEGGKNCLKPQTETQKDKLRWSHGALTKDEVEYLRISYKEQKSPLEIYNSLYKDKMQYASFMNIWVGKRYSTVMPEVFKGKRHTKLTLEIAKAIRLDRKELQLSYEALSKKYNISKATIADIINNRTWKENDT